MREIYRKNNNFIREREKKERKNNNQPLLENKILERTLSQFEIILIK